MQPYDAFIVGHWRLQGLTWDDFLASKTASDAPCLVSHPIWAKTIKRNQTRPTVIGKDHTAACRFFNGRSPAHRTESECPVSL